MYNYHGETRLHKAWRVANLAAGPLARGLGYADSLGIFEKELVPRKKIMAPFNSTWTPSPSTHKTRIGSSKAASFLASLSSRNTSKRKHPFGKKSSTGKRHKVHGFRSGLNSAPKRVKQEEPGGLYKPAIKRIKAKVTRVKSKRLPRVTKLFKAKVQKSLLGKSISGYSKVTYLGMDWFLPTQDNTQAVFDSDLNTVTNNGSVTPWSFTLLQFRQQLSQLFAGVAPANNATALIGALSNYFPINSLKFRLLNSSTKYSWKNNTPHSVIIKVYECAPKRVGGYNPGAPTLALSLDSTGTSIADPESFRTALNTWISSLTEDFFLGYEPSKGTINSGNTPPLIAPGTTDLHRSPTSCKTLKGWFKFSVDEVVLAPGQSFEKYIQGPRNIDIDYGKCFKNNIFMDIQKYSRAIIGVVIPVLAGGSGGTSTYFGRVGDSTGVDAASGETIPMERVDQYQFLMPEETLGLVPTGAVFATARRPIRQENVFSPVRPSGTINHDIQENFSGQVST